MLMASSGFYNVAISFGKSVADCEVAKVGEAAGVAKNNTRTQRWKDADWRATTTKRVDSL
jgi:hypothetical protein